MDRDRFRDIVLSNIRRYPLAQVEDLYKLSHQAALGSEHAVSDLDAARDWLVRELDEIAASSPEPLIDEISADGKVVRVHLRPYLVMGGEPESLLQAFVNTANGFKGSIQLLEQYLQTIKRLVEVGDLQYQLDSCISFIEEKRSDGYPPVHHSVQYAEAYKPSYRVIARPFLPEGIK